MCIRSYCICYYLAEFLVVTICNGRTYEKTIYRFLAVLYQIKKIYFWLSGAPCSAGALGPGLAGLCLKTALFLGKKIVAIVCPVQFDNRLDKMDFSTPLIIHYLSVT